MTDEQEKLLEKILDPKAEIFTVTLDGLEMYMGVDEIKAIQIHGIITAVLYQKKISGRVVMLGDQHDKPMLDENWNAGVKNAKDQS